VDGIGTGARRVAIAVVGGVVLLTGVLMLALPGPGMLVIPAGLAILALEFAWARRWLNAVRERSRAVVDGWRSSSPAGS